MTLDKAKQIITEIAAARRKWGKQANPPYKLDVIMDALVVISPELTEECPPCPEGISQDEVTKLRRQLAACQNREKARKGPIPDLPAEADVDD